MKMFERTRGLVFPIVLFSYLYTVSLALELSLSTEPQLPVLEGRTLEITCSSTHPSPIRWTLNGVEVISSNRRMINQTSPSTSVLRINRIDRVADGGMVTCGPISGHEKKSNHAELTVTWLDNAVVRLESPNDISGADKVNEIVLLCDGDMGPGDIQYHWFRNNERLTNSHQMNIQKSRLHIKQATARENGVYRCSAHYDNATADSKQNFYVNLLDPNLPRLTVQPEDALVAPKAKAVFYCQYESADVIEWFKNDNEEPFENGERVGVHKNGTLTIQNITRRDEGFYSCVAYRNYNKTQLMRYTAKLKVAHFQPITVQDFEPVLSETRVVHAQTGHAFRLGCFSAKDSSPAAFVMWKNPENHLISDRGDIKVEDGTLVIDIVKPEHQGLYTCAQENLGGSQEMSLYLVANPTPKIVKNPLDITVDENQSCTFKCTVEAHKQENLYFDLKKFWTKIVDQSYLNILNGKPQHSPHSKNHSGEREFPQNLANMGDLTTFSDVSTEPRVPMKKDQLIQKWLDDLNLDLFDVVWKKDYGKIVKEDQGRVELSRHGTLKFEKTLPSDKGQYRCEAITLAGHHVSSWTATLTVVEKLKFSPSPVNRKLELNSTGKVHCKAQGTPTPNVTWYQWIDSPLPNDVASVNGTLVFSKVSKEHNGNYTCVAMNTQGSILTTIVIDVVVSPRFLSPLPSEIIDVNLGDPVWIHCIVEGDPTPMTEWDKNFDMLNAENGIDMDRIKQLDNGTLYITSVRLEDSDHYGCTAGNSAGLKREGIILMVHNQGGVIGGENGDGIMSKALLITMSIIYILLVVGLMLWCRIRRRRKLADTAATAKLENGDIEMNDKDERDKEHDKLIENIPDGDTDNSVKKKNKCNGTYGPKPKNGSLGNRSGNNTANSGGDGSEVSKRSGQGGAYDKLIIDKECLGDFVNLGRGEFGEVFSAKLENDSVLPEESHRIVMVKSLQQVAQKDENLLAEFKRQLDTFSRLKHENLASVIGLCNQSQPHYMIFQYTDWGDFKQFLLATRTPEEVVYQEKGEPSKVETRTGSNPLNLVQQLAIASHIARGMEAIADARIVHKDLATRNCLLTSKLSVKISIIGLTKDTYSKEYCKHVNQVIPLRWLPSECVYDSDYSTKSDVYMFGCAVWEIFHRGELPFIKMNDTSVLNHLKNNTLKWKSHPDMPQELGVLLEQCWDSSPKNRPTFNEITRQLQKILMDAKNEEKNRIEE